MTQDRSRAALLKFLDYVAAKGLMPGNTAAARKAAAGKVLGVLSDEEAADMLTVDLPHVMTRFNNLHGQQYTPASLSTYQSRVKAALDDFETWLKNPTTFKPNRQNARPNKERSGKPLQSFAVSKDSPEMSESAPQIRQVQNLREMTLPIPIRPDLTVFVQGLPYDLTKAEANKIAAVIVAMAS